MKKILSNEIKFYGYKSNAKIKNKIATFLKNKNMMILKSI